MSQAEWGLVFAFRDQSPSFAHGFDCGRIWHQLKTRTAPFEETVIGAIREDLIAMATHLGWRETITELEHDWIKVHFVPEGRSR